MSEQAEPAIGSAEHAKAMRDWETEMRLMPSRERDRRVEIGQTQPDVLGEQKGDTDADVGYQGPQSK